MAVDFQHPFVGRVAVYTAGHPGAKREQGVITSVSKATNTVFVRFGFGNTSAGCTADDRLTFLDGGQISLKAGGANGKA